MNLGGWQEIALPVFLASHIGCQSIIGVLPQRFDRAPIGLMFNEVRVLAMVCGMSPVRKQPQWHRGCPLGAFAAAAPGQSFVPDCLDGIP